MEKGSLWGKEGIDIMEWRKRDPMGTRNENEGLTDHLLEESMVFR
jgi:hypothetical protein